jgi:hypothetical protein
VVCRQCGAGLSPAMVESGACGFCGTAIADVAPKKHVEKVVDAKVEAAKAQLRRDLQADIAKARRAEPSPVVVAAAEAGRYTAARVWGCGAGCLSTIGSVLFFLLIFGFVGGMQLLPHLGPLLDRAGLGPTPPAEQPAKPSPAKPHPAKPHPTKKPPHKGR